MSGTAAFRIAGFASSTTRIRNNCDIFIWNFYFAFMAAVQHSLSVTLVEHAVFICQSSLQKRQWVSALYLGHLIVPFVVTQDPPDMLDGGGRIERQEAQFTHGLLAFDGYELFDPRF